MPAFLKRDGERLLLFLRVTPGASRAAIDGEWRGPDGDARLGVRVAAPPEGGKANAAVVRLVSKCTDIRRSAINVAAGKTSRLKTLAILTDATAEAIGARLLAAAEWKP